MVKPGHQSEPINTDSSEAHRSQWFTIELQEPRPDRHALSTFPHSRSKGIPGLPGETQYQISILEARVPDGGSGEIEIAGRLSGNIYQWPLTPVIRLSCRTCLHTFNLNDSFRTPAPLTRALCSRLGHLLLLFRCFCYSATASTLYASSRALLSHSR